MMKIKYLLRVLFTLFCFCYLYFIQGEALASAQYVFSHGVTHYSLFFGALWITVSLLFVQWLCGRLIKLPASHYSLSFFPSILLLSVLTDMPRSNVEQATVTGHWMWAVPLLLLLYILIIWFVNYRSTIAYNRSSDTGDTGTAYFSNFFWLALMLLLPALSNSVPDTYLYELKAERHIVEGDYDEASDVASKSEATTARLNNLRAFAFVMQGRGVLPERLFAMRQTYGSDGLLTLTDTTKSMERFTMTDALWQLGINCSDTHIPLERLMELAIDRFQLHADSLLTTDSLNVDKLNDSIRHSHAQIIHTLKVQIARAADYRLSALLLDKNLPKFIELLPTYYPEVADTLDSVRRTLPRAFREAVSIIAPEQADSATLSDYYDYAVMVDSIQNPTIRRNLTRRDYGQTYWWYFDFQEEKDD